MAKRKGGSGTERESRKKVQELDLCVQELRTRGEITIPKRLRRELGMVPGKTLVCLVREGRGLTVTPLEARTVLTALKRQAEMSPEEVERLFGPSRPRAKGGR